VRKVGLILVIFFLILSTAIIKNSAKQIEDEIFSLNENLRVLNSELENILLENDYLSSPEKLIEFQSTYFEDELIQQDINNIKILNFNNDEKIITNLEF
tara:strand:- start:220 stop:516 length:297 start_codon:yes stop_codon:yes gene_type:complete